MGKMMNWEQFENLKVNVLGTSIPILVIDELEESSLTEDDYGCFVPYLNQIQINKKQFEEETKECLERVVRHEIIHAFMFLSSFQPDLYPVDEEFIVEWFAQMLPRINAAIPKLK